MYILIQVQNQSKLYEDLMIEQLQIYGQDVYYIPRKMAGTDAIWQEDISSSFESSYLIEMYMENVDGYEGEKELMSKFGLISKTMQLLLLQEEDGNNLFR